MNIQEVNKIEVDGYTVFFGSLDVMKENKFNIYPHNPIEDSNLFNEPLTRLFWNADKNGQAKAYGHFKVANVMLEDDPYLIPYITQVLKNQLKILVKNIS